MHSAPSGNDGKSLSKLRQPATPPDMEALNVGGRCPTSPEDGFGQLWSKSYALAFVDSSHSPEEVISTWKSRFDQFWPEGSRLHIDGRWRAGNVAAVKLGLGAGPHVYTGMLVAESGARSFRLATPQGHLFTGWIRFSARDVDGATNLHVEVRARATDPLYELSLILGGHRLEDMFWEHTLQAVAAHFGENGTVTKKRQLLKRQRKWSHARLIWYNAALRSLVWDLSAPLRNLWARRPGERGQRHA